MLIYANYREDDGADLFFSFCIKRSVSIKVTIINNTGKIEKYIDMTLCGMELEWHPLTLAPFLLRYTFYQKS